jgi:curved DNA-binding protein CbpA
MNTLYNLLGTSPGADNETLKRAFREAVKATHPDIHADDADAQSRFRQIVDAYTLLRDAKQCARYDWLLQQQFRLKPEYQQRPLKHERQHGSAGSKGALACNGVRRGPLDKTSGPDSEGPRPRQQPPTESSRAFWTLAATLPAGERKNSQRTSRARFEASADRPSRPCRW